MAEAISLRSKRPVLMRAAPAIGEGIVTGYASIYGVRYDIGGRKEEIRPGAFRACIEHRPVVNVFYSHDWERGPVGVAYPSEDAKGLRFRGRMFVDEDTFVRRLYQAMKGDALNQWSVGMIYRQVEQDGRDIIVVEAELVEISLVVRAAVPGAETIEVRDWPGVVRSVIPSDRQEWVLAHLDSEPVRQWVKKLARRRGLAA